MTTLHNVYRIAASLCLYVFIVSPTGLAREGENSLAVIDGGVQRSEDAPYVPKDFQFLPGEYVYFTFHIAGFAVQKNEQRDVKLLALEYEVTAEDAANVALAEPVKGKITDNLTSEDKNWVPKRRASFLLPSYVGTGEFHVRVVVKDLIAKTDAVRDYPFRMGGVEVGTPNTIQVESFDFLRNESDEKALDVPAYAPGDTVWARFEMVGFKHGAGNEYKLSYGVNVLRPDGKAFLDQANAAQIAADSFYPAQFVPGELQLTTPKNAARGSYQITLTVRDLLANQSYALKRVFTIE
jgi:hypothetical protein